MVPASALPCSFVNQNHHAYLFVVCFFNRKHASWGEGILSAMFLNISLGFGQCQTLKKGGGKGRNREEGREGRQGGEGGRKRGNEKTEEEILFLLFFLESDHYNDKPSNVYSLYLLQNVFALLASFQ